MLVRLPGLMLAAIAIPAVAAVPLAPHHAVYALTLAGSPNGEVVAAHGTMSFDVQDACTGWTTAQRLQLVFTNRDGQDIHMVSDYATFEAKDGSQLRFHTRQTTDDAVTSQLDGDATVAPVGGEAVFEGATRRVIRLPAGTKLPMAHTSAILAAAAAGQRFLSVPLFDGTASGGAEDTFVTINGWQPPGGASIHAASGGAVRTLLHGLDATHVHISFFDRAPAKELPDYNIAMRYFANGIADQLSMDFGDFLMGGELQSLHTPPAARC